MICKRFNDCADFLAFYLKLNREDLHKAYVDEYCCGLKRSLCERKKFSEQHGINPALDLTPLGEKSLLHRLYR